MWALALQARKQAAAAEKQHAQARPPPAHALPPVRPAACRAIGQRLPALWPTAGRSQTQRTALLRCLIAQVVLPRARRDQVHTRMVWRGGEPPTFAVPVAVGALTDLPTAHEMAQQMRGLWAAGTSDDARACQRTRPGYRAPRRPAVWPRTVKGIRLKLGLMPHRSQSHPRHIAGDLRGPQVAQAWGITPHWVYHQSKGGTVVIQRDAQTRLDLLPARPEPLEALGQLRAGYLSARRSCASSRRRPSARGGPLAVPLRTAPPRCRHADTGVAGGTMEAPRSLPRSAGLRTGTAVRAAACNARHQHAVHGHAVLCDTYQSYCLQPSYA